METSTLNWQTQHNRANSQGRKSNCVTSAKMFVDATLGPKDPKSLSLALFKVCVFTASPLIPLCAVSEAPSILFLMICQSELYCSLHLEGHLILFCECWELKLWHECPPYSPLQVTDFSHPFLTLRSESFKVMPSLHGKQMGKQWKQWQTLFFGAPKSLQMVTAGMKLEDICSLEAKLWPT